MSVLFNPAHGYEFKGAEGGLAVFDHVDTESGKKNPVSLTELQCWQLAVAFSGTAGSSPSTFKRWHPDTVNDLERGRLEIQVFKEENGHTFATDPHPDLYDQSLG